MKIVPEPVVTIENERRTKSEQTVESQFSFGRSKLAAPNTSGLSGVSLIFLVQRFVRSALQRSSFFFVSFSSDLSNTVFLHTHITRLFFPFEFSAQPLACHARKSNEPVSLQLKRESSDTETKQ